MALASALTAQKKRRKVSLGRKGSFTIKHPGAFRAFASKKGLSTKAAASKYSDAGGHVGAMARSALGLMAMHHKK